MNYTILIFIAEIIFTVMAVCGAVFSYFVKEIEEGKKQKFKYTKTLRYASMIIGGIGTVSMHSK